MHPWEQSLAYPQADAPRADASSAIAASSRTRRWGHRGRGVHRHIRLALGRGLFRRHAFESGRA